MLLPHYAGMTFMNVHGGTEDGPYRCPCCGFITLVERGAYELCRVCYWEDDGQDEHDAAEVRGGPNAGLSLEQARRNFRALGACNEHCTRFVRPPLPEEHPSSGLPFGTGTLD